MNELTLESLAKRVEELERRLNEPTAGKDWRLVAGMFTGSEFMKQVIEEGSAIRQAERDELERGQSE